jgi:hypothetical protein
MHKTSYKQNKTQTGNTQNKLQKQTSDTQIKWHTQTKLQPKIEVRTQARNTHKTSYKHTQKEQQTRNKLQAQN